MTEDVFEKVFSGKQVITLSAKHKYFMHATVKEQHICQYDLQRNTKHDKSN